MLAHAASSTVLALVTLSLVLAYAAASAASETAASLSRCVLACARMRHCLHIRVCLELYSLSPKWLFTWRASGFSHGVLLDTHWCKTNAITIELMSSTGINDHIGPVLVNKMQVKFGVCVNLRRKACPSGICSGLQCFTLLGRSPFTVCVLACARIC